MSHLRVIFDNQEIERRDLTGPLVIGRAADCDLAVRDILLSRRHCRIDPAEGQGWVVSDLSSKNGTILNGSPITSSTLLTDGDVLNLSRVKVYFGVASLAEAGLTPLRCPPIPQRPADPMETLSGTLSGFQYLEPGQSAAAPPDSHPLPRPEPKRPAAYAREDIYSLLTAIASSSWDSIYEEAKRPVPATMELNVDVKLPRPPRPLSPMDLSVPASPPAAPAGRFAGGASGMTIRRFRQAALLALLMGLLIFKCFFADRATLASPPSASASARVSITEAQRPVQLAAPAPADVIGRVVIAALPIFL